MGEHAVSTRRKYKQLPVQVFELPAGRRLAVIGGRHPHGTYVLRVRVTQPLDLYLRTRCGWETVHFPVGDVCYVGSGHGGLANRVVRHATRTATQPPHPILAHILTTFRRVGLGNADPTPQGGKHIGRWVADKVLDQGTTDLVAVFAVRWHRKLEKAVGEMMAVDPAVQVIAPGLGGSDYQYKLTLLLRTVGGDKWWDALPARLARLALVEELRRFQGAVLVDEPVDDGRLPDENLVTLLNLRPERATAVLRRMVNDGMKFEPANRASRGIFDTHDWAEVLNRLQRGRGSAERACRLLLKPRVAAKTTHDARDLAKQLLSAAAELKKLVTRQRVIGDGDEKKPKRPNARSKKPNTNAIGLLRGCLSFVAKNARDIPRLRQYHFDVPRPTAIQKAKVLAELNLIRTAAKEIIERCRASAPATRRPKSSTARHARVSVAPRRSSP